MTEDTKAAEQDSLGDLLRKTRLDRGLDIEQVANETRIAPHILRAMESDDFLSLPAPAFSRGFYGLYAKMLALDPNSIQLQYKNILNQTNGNQQQPQRLTTNIKNLAERPPIPAPSIISFTLLLIFIVFAVLAWFFHWNPADFLSKQLRNLDQEQQIEQQVETATPLPEANSEIIINQEIPTDTKPEAQKVGYTLNGVFGKATSITITIDEGIPEQIEIKKGEFKSWYADQSIIITMPSTEEISLTFNDDIPISLPPAKENITISIPEYFLQ